MTALIQPLMLLFMGGLIAFIMAAVLLPIFDLNTLAAGS
jgi:type II secretory pathway component PulF